MDLLKKIASPEQVPAGGAAAALSTGLAIALLHKVAFMATERCQDEQKKNDLLGMRKEIDRLMHHSQRLVEHVPDSVLRFSRSRNSGDAAEKQTRFVEFITVTMEIMEKSYSTLYWIEQVNRLVPREMGTHLKVACELLLGAMNGTVHVVSEPIRLIKDPQRRGHYLKNLNKLHQDSEKKYHGVIGQLAQ